MLHWKPEAALNRLHDRAQLLVAIRQFFAARNVTEVETPLLTSTTGTDVHLQPFEVPVPGTGSARSSLFLQTSPEFAMKRLLAAGSGSIYQVCKAFRAGDSSRTHNQEFTMLEWYRVGFSLSDLMDEVSELMTATLHCGPIERLSYRALFMQFLGFDPHTITIDDLRAVAHSKISFSDTSHTATDYLQQLLAQCIEPLLPEFCFIYHYPVAQAALAATTVDSSGQQVAERFELFARGMEIANGYYELTDVDEQRERFLADNRRRQTLSLAEYPLDENLLAALAHGLPQCAGVALGVDRLLMLKTGEKDIRKVLTFVGA